MWPVLLLIDVSVGGSWAIEFCEGQDVGERRRWKGLLGAGEENEQTLCNER